MVLNFGQVSLVQSEVDRVWGLLNPGKLLDSKVMEGKCSHKGPQAKKKDCQRRKGC